MGSDDRKNAESGLDPAWHAFGARVAVFSGVGFALALLNLGSPVHEATTRGGFVLVAVLGIWQVGLGLLQRRLSAEESGSVPSDEAETDGVGEEQAA